MKSFLVTAVAILTFVSAEAPHKKLTVGSPEYHESWVERKYDASTANAHEMEHVMRTVEHGRRPVIGVLTEPIRGDLIDESETT